MPMLKATFLINTSKKKRHLHASLRGPGEFLVGHYQTMISVDDKMEMLADKMATTKQSLSYIYIYFFEKKGK